MRILLLIILFLILYPIIKIWRTMRRVRERMEDVMQAQWDTDEETEGEHKRYTKDIGEYVEYEDIIGLDDNDIDDDDNLGSRPPRSTADSNREREYEESQIVDAEFDDLYYDD